MNTLIAFTAKWCAPCRKIEPILGELGQQYGLTVETIDVEKSPEIAKENDVRCLPTLIITNSGKTIGRQNGLFSKDSICRWIEKAIGGN